METSQETETIIPNQPPTDGLITVSIVNTAEETTKPSEAETPGVPTDNHGSESGQPEPVEHENPKSEISGEESTVLAGASWLLSSISANVVRVLPEVREKSAVEKTASKSDDEIGDHVIDADALLLSAANKVSADVVEGWASINKFLDDILENHPSQQGGSTANAVDSTTSKSGAADLDVSQKFESLFASSAGKVSHYDDMKQEEIVDGFECALVQKYRCYHNTLTPEHVYTIHGLLFISERYAAFASLDNNALNTTQSAPSVKTVVPLESVNKVQQGQTGGMMRLLLNDKSYIVLSNFRNPSDYNGALALFEHMRESLLQSSTAAAEKEVQVPPEAVAER